MRSKPLYIAFVTLLGLNLAGTACTVDGGDRPEDWTLDGNVRDAGSDSGPAEVHDAEDVRDVGDAQDTFDTHDTADLDPLDCTCAVEGANCELVEQETRWRVERRALCVHEEADCSEGSCPVGFVCRAGRCDCDNDVHGPKCRPECADHADCGEQQYCNVNDRCFARWECDSNHALCPTGYWCDREYEPRPTCRQSAERPDGASCEKDWECESGFCFEQECIRSCLAEEDCPGDNRACGPFDQFKESLGCYEPYEVDPDCEISCPDDQLCTRDECRPHACHRTGQCPEGDCVLSPKGRTEDGLGQCTAGGRLCDGSEFRIEEGDPFCRLPIDCETLDDTFRSSCPEGYECVQGEPDRGSDFYTSWCSRRVTEGEWP